MSTVRYERVALGDIMTGHYGPTREEAASQDMADFEALLQDPTMYEAVAPDQVFATDCGDGRVDESGERQARGFFAFGGSYLPVLGEALADPDAVISAGLKLDTHAHARFTQLHAINPERRFVWHTAAGTPQDGIGCGLLAGRQTVFERIAGNESTRFWEAGNKLQLISNEKSLTPEIQRNAQKLLDYGYLDVSDTSLRQVPESIQGLAIEETLVGPHKEKVYLANNVPYERLRVTELQGRFKDWQVFTTSSWGIKLEAQEWAKTAPQALGEAQVAQLGRLYADAAGFISVSGIATLAPPELPALVRFAV